MYLVAGLGKTGCSIARYLQRRGHVWVAFDTREAPEQLEEFHLLFPEAKVFLGSLPESIYSQLTEVLASPGVSLDHPVIVRAKQQGISVVGDIECLAREISAPVIAITGTNGKSTVTTLVSEMASAAGLSVAMAGNIGIPVLDRLEDGQSYDVWVLELSSFQLELTFSLQPLAATILNVTPDHLDRHHTLEAYVHAKQRVYTNAKYKIYDRADSLTYPKENCAPNQCVSFGLDQPAVGHWGVLEQDGVVYLMHGQQRLLPAQSMRIKGKHNWLNALAACALADSLSIDKACMVDVLTHFKGLTHRTQWIRTLHGVEWINDSKGTNIGATCSALSGIGPVMTGKMILIAGGQGKGADFATLREPIAHYVRCVILLGEDAALIQQALEGVVDMIHVSSLNDAVQVAQKKALPGDVVLLSPACASLDMFRDFNHRGDVFVAAVEALS